MSQIAGIILCCVHCLHWMHIDDVFIESDAMLQNSHMGSTGVAFLTDCHSDLWIWYHPARTLPCPVCTVWQLCAAEEEFQNCLLSTLVLNGCNLKQLTWGHSNVTSFLWKHMDDNICSSCYTVCCTQLCQAPFRGGWWRGRSLLLQICCSMAISVARLVQKICSCTHLGGNVLY